MMSAVSRQKVVRNLRKRINTRERPHPQEEAVINLTKNVRHLKWAEKRDIRGLALRRTVETGEEGKIKEITVATEMKEDIDC